MGTGEGDHGEPDLWGGRFRTGLDPAVRRFTGSLSFDRRLARHDLVASMAHVRSLWEARVLEDGDARRLLEGLSGILSELEEGELEVEGPDEDVHGWIERTLTDRVGAVGGKVHTGRSRNDQTGAALRLYLRERLAGLVAGALDAAEAWTDRAEEHREDVMPGYTHLQPAQPVTLGHHLMAHARAVLADARRLRDARREAGVSPLGAAALAGSSHRLDPGRTAQLAGLEEAYDNSVLAVSDRDYVAAALFSVALLMTHLSRWATEMVLWTSPQFGFAELPDGLAQGSSLMPQKKNPEVAEVLRGKTGRVVGALAGFLTTLKGLPLAYNSDLQEDKEPLFDALDTGAGALEVTAATARGLRFHPARMRAACDRGFLAATDLADELVRRGTPFREAHRQVGRAVLAAEERGCGLADLPLDVLRECCPGAEEEMRERLDVEAVVASRDGRGDPAPARVGEQVRRAREEIAGLRRWRDELEEPPVYRAYRSGTLLEAP
jgi:argininosuccinate lyase